MGRSVSVIGTRGYPSYYGGFETAVRKLAPYLADEGWSVSVYGRHGKNLSTASADDRIRRISTPGVEFKSLSTLTYGLTACLHAMREKPDVALVMNVANGFWLPLLKLRRIPTVINVDGIEWERSKWGRLAKFVFKTGARMTARFGDVLIADSIEIQRRWSTEFSRECVFIPYGGDQAPQTLTMQDPFPNRSYILAVARFVPENTIPEFLQAVRQLASEFEVVIVGSSGYGGPLDQQVKELALNFPKVHWLGHVANDARLLSLWKNCGVYFHGHSVGGTNPALVQAMANGAPIVARDTVYNREVLADSGEFVQPDVDSIVSGLRKVMRSPLLQQQLSAAAQRRLSEGYTWDAVCKAYDSELSAHVSLIELAK